MLSIVRKIGELEEQARWAEELAHGHRTGIINAAFPPDDAAAAAFAENADGVARAYRQEARALRRRLLISAFAIAALVVAVGVGLALWTGR